MQRCFDLAKRGEGFTLPNPLVGAVIVHDDKIIAEGYHEKYGGPHAEVNAIRRAPADLLSSSTLYVSLEPCVHHGKTPPCVDLIIESGITRVVIPVADPNPLVCGKGIRKLTAAGIEVTTGILESAAREVNRRFFCFHEKHRSYVVLKWAQSGDGFMGKEGVNILISGQESLQLAHRWRAAEMAVMVGTNTAVTDNPQLNVRLAEGNNPLRIVPDRTLRLPDSLRLFDGASPTIIFTERQDGKGNAEYQVVKFDEDILSTILARLSERNVISLLVEGGAQLLGSFIRSNLWDEARVVISPDKLSSGIRAPSIPMNPVSEERAGNDRIITFRNSFLQ